MAVHSEQDLNSAAFDQPTCLVRSKIIICATPRVGSYLLCRALIKNGVGVPHEYFNGLNASTIGRRCGLNTIDSNVLQQNGAARDAYVKLLFERRTKKGIFAFKLHRGQFRQYFNTPEQLALFQGAHFIHMYREDLLGQAISFHISLLTGRWGVDDEVATRPQENPDFFDNAALLARMRELAVQDMEWREFFARNGIEPYSMSYECLRSDPPMVVRQIVERFKLDIDVNAIAFAEREPGEIRDQGVPSRQEIRAQFLSEHQEIVRVPTLQFEKPAEQVPVRLESASIDLAHGLLKKVELPNYRQKRRQSISLCMIVKNEAPVIAKCLESVRPLIDYWVIADTGSTDGTQGIILETLKDVPGELHQRPWVDFAFNRSETLAMARTHADYSIFIDADDRLEITPGYKLPFLKVESGWLEVIHKQVHFWRPHLVSNELPWRFEGILHEFLSLDLGDGRGRIFASDRSLKRISGLKIVMGEGGARRRQTDSSRYARDAELFSRALETETDPFLRSRYTFYLAQSYQESGNLKDALSFNLKRAHMGLWNQEVYISLLRAANIMVELNYPPDDTIQIFVRAQGVLPERAEAFHGAARACRGHKRFEEGYRFAKSALKLAPPEEALFLDRWIYDYGLLDEYAVCAYWAGKYDECLHACRRLIRERKIPDGAVARIEQNAKFAQEKMAAAT